VAREWVTDRFGNEIYLTDERWLHIIETHEEMVNYRSHLFVTIRTGRRRQDTFDSSKYKYSRRFTDLPEEFTHVVVVVKFSHRLTKHNGEVSNNFVLTAYQVSRREI
jgi:hypothetical protein